jgi:hypothetical protein
MERSRKVIYFKSLLVNLLLWVFLAALMTWFLIYIDYKPDTSWLSPVFNLVECMPIWKVILIQILSCLISGFACVEIIYRSIFDKVDRDGKYFTWAVSLALVMLAMSFVGLYLARSSMVVTCA